MVERLHESLVSGVKFNRYKRNYSKNGLMPCCSQDRIGLYHSVIGYLYDTIGIDDIDGCDK
jgi:hypothetical protein